MHSASPDPQHHDTRYAANMEHDFPADEDQDSTPRAFAVTAPRRPGGREQPAEMFDSAGVPEDLADTCIEVRFEPRTMYTISFADELIPETLVRRRCRHLTLRGISRRSARSLGSLPSTMTWLNV